MTENMHRTLLGRRSLLTSGGIGLGAIALSEIDRRASTVFADSADSSGLHHPAKAKRVIYLFQSGAPSQLDLFDPKPLLVDRHGTQLPDEVRQGQRLTGMSGNQSSLPLVGSPFRFEARGESGIEVSDLLPHLATVVDDVCLIRSMYTDAINHGPAVTFMQTGSQFPGRPSIGAWLDYGLGQGNEEVPAFVVLVTKGKSGQPLVSRFWGSGFLPSRHQGVRFRSGDDPVLYLNNPPGIDSSSRRRAIDALAVLHRDRASELGDPAIESRIAQYEMAFRMQRSIPEVTNLVDEPDHVLDAYGPDARTPGTFASNCLLARRLAERGVRFIQLYHQGWDHHGGLPKGLPQQCRETDQPSAALLNDLKQKGMLEDTLVIWGGEFGRTNYCQGNLTATDFGRDHHPKCFSLWMAGGGVRPGHVVGQTDDYGYNIQEHPVHVHDLQATILHLLGIDHQRLTHRYQGRQFRLTDVHGSVVDDVLA